MISCFIPPVTAALFIGYFFVATASRAEVPCDFKGIAVGSRMAPAEVMAALGVTKYTMNPPRPSFDETWPLIQKYGGIPAMELEEWKLGPYCDENSCRLPYGVTVGNNNIPVNIFFSFHDGQITEIEVSFNHVFWDDMLPIWDQKYGADWNVDLDEMPITDVETKKMTMLERISLDHITKGVNRTTSDRCQISATNLDIVFQHHDPMGPYHSVFVITLVSKNF
jgi:hypothetical protein